MNIRAGGGISFPDCKSRTGFARRVLRGRTGAGRER